MCLSLFWAAPSLNAQMQAQPVLGSAAQPFDATNLREPAGIGDIGLVQAGDDPAYARPDFDDSKWLPVNAKSQLGEYFPHDRPNVVWRRIHIRISPTETGLALQEYLQVIPAFEVYVNGQKLMGSGRVEPSVPYTSYAAIVARIPEAQLQSGSLVIAVRARADRSWRGGAFPGFWADQLRLGQESALRNQELLRVIGANGAEVLWNLLGLGVGIAAFVLFTAQRLHLEYLWIFLSGVQGAANSSLDIIFRVNNLPMGWVLVYYLLEFAGWILLLLICQSFLRKRFGWYQWLCAVAAVLTNAAGDAIYLYGSLPYQDMLFLVIPLEILVAAVLPWLFFRQLRRGNREVGIC